MQSYAVVAESCARHKNRKGKRNWACPQCTTVFIMAFAKQQSHALVDESTYR